MHTTVLISSRHNTRTCGEPECHHWFSRLTWDGPLPCAPHPTLCTLKCIVPWHKHGLSQQAKYCTPGTTEGQETHNMGAEGRSLFSMYVPVLIQNWALHKREQSGTCIHIWLTIIPEMGWAGGLIHMLYVSFEGWFIWFACSNIPWLQGVRFWSELGPWHVGRGCLSFSSYTIFLTQKNRECYLPQWGNFYMYSACTFLQRSKQIFFFCSEKQCKEIINTLSLFNMIVNMDQAHAFQEWMELQSMYESALIMSPSLPLSISVLPQSLQNLHMWR